MGKEHRRGKRKDKKEKAKIEKEEILIEKPEVEEEIFDIPKLSQESIDYFKGIENLLAPHQLAEQTQDERELLIQNILKELEGKEYAIALDFHASRVIEKILLICPLETRLYFMQGFCNDEKLFRFLCSHLYASHVLETLYKTIVKDFEADPQLIDLFLSHLKVFINSNVKCFKGKWFDCMKDQYASHLLRLWISILSGIKPPTSYQSKKSEKYAKWNDLQPSDDWWPQQYEPDQKLKNYLLIITEELWQAIGSEINLKVLCTHSSASPVLCLLMTQYKNQLEEKQSKADFIFSLLLKDEKFLNEMQQHAVATHFLQSCLFNCSQSLICQYFNMIKKKLISFLFHPLMNYVMQTLFEKLEKEQLEFIMKELKKDSESVWSLLTQKNRLAVYLSLLEQCQLKQVLTLEWFQNDFVPLFQSKVIQEGNTNDLLLLKILALSKESVIKPNIDQSGARLLSVIFTFDFLPETELLKEINDLPKHFLVLLLQNPIGCRCFESLLTNEHLSKGQKIFFLEKSIYTLLDQLLPQSHFIYFLEKAMPYLSPKQKEKWIEQMLKKKASWQEQWQTKAVGKKLWNLLKLDLFQSDRQRWFQLQQSQNSFKQLKKKESFMQSLLQQSGSNTIPISDTKKKEVKKEEVKKEEKRKASDALDNVFDTSKKVKKNKK